MAEDGEQLSRVQGRGCEQSPKRERGTKREKSSGSRGHVLCGIKKLGETGWLRWLVKYLT